ncbi:hypothetical protein [Shewanella sp. SM74]|uniref:hypothetical protein n=1 Tax=Shewanella sp. SM74 TaxID=2912807 RepID=UPI0021DB1F15|nr:hypothetical protein [Shewanella sp. SM74]MCU8012951.1 hypothetical protein [Shewanella sp. SM74]
MLIKTQADKSGKNDRDDAILNLEISELKQSHTQHYWLGEIFDFSGQNSVSSTQMITD